MDRRHEQEGNDIVDMRCLESDDEEIVLKQQFDTHTIWHASNQSQDILDSTILNLPNYLHDREELLLNIGKDCLVEYGESAV